MSLPIHPSFTERPAIVFLEIFPDVESLGDFFRLDLWLIPMAFDPKKGMRYLLVLPSIHLRFPEVADFHSFWFPLANHTIFPEKA
jgi:hypothetical protein